MNPNLEQVRCYMRNVFVSLCLVALLPLCGCAGRLPFGLGVDYQDREGRPLDHPYGDDKPITSIGFYQQYDGWVSIAVNGGVFMPVAYRDSLPVEFTSKKYFDYEVSWKEVVGYNGELRVQHYRGVGLFNQAITITEDLLRNWAKLEIVVENTSPMPLSFADGRGNTFILKTFEDKTLFVVDGEYFLSWRLANANTYATIGHRYHYLAPGHKVPYKGRAVDAVFLIH